MDFPPARGLPIPMVMGLGLSWWVKGCRGAWAKAPWPEAQHVSTSKRHLLEWRHWRHKRAPRNVLFELCGSPEMHGLYSW